MNKLWKPYKRLFTEDIYGNNAIVYHRTKIPDLINKVYTSGFKIGTGDMYGKGFYSTYDLKSQSNEEMTHIYGDVIVRFQVSVNNFFFFDYSEFIKAPIFKKLKSTEKTFIEDQIKYYNITYNKSYIDKIIDKKFSSTLALNLYNYSNMSRIVDGIVFTGSRDGRVLVCYTPKLIIPLSYSLDDGKTFEKVSPKNMEYIKNVWKLKQAGFQPDFRERPFVPEDFGIVDYNWSNDGLLYVNESVALIKKSLNKIPFKFGGILGSFLCQKSNLFSLENSPIKVSDSFECFGNNLTSLKFAPKIVGVNFNCSDNKLTSLRYSPEKVGNNFYCNHNKLKTLKGCPKEVDGDFVCNYNPVKFTQEYVRSLCKVGGKIYV
jgi:hypothetical protein